MNKNDFNAELINNEMLIEFLAKYPYSYRIYYCENEKEVDIDIYQTTIEDIFDERKYVVFTPKNEIDTLFMEIKYENETLGIAVCEDIKKYGY